jgi:hypothetical protein
VAYPNPVIGQGNFGTEHGAVTHHQGFVKRLATVAQPRRQIVQVCLNGCLVGGSSGPGLLEQGQVAIGSDIQTQLALVVGGVVGKAEVDEGALRIAPMCHEGGHIIENDGKVDAGFLQGNPDNIEPDRPQVRIQGSGDLAKRMLCTSCD